METLYTFRMWSDEAPDLIPKEHKRISEKIVEATTSFDLARSVFSAASRRYAESGAHSVTSSLIVHNIFTPQERAQANWFHVWLEHYFHQLAPDPEPIPECPVCGIALGVDLCAVVPRHEVAAHMAYASNNVWLLKPALAARLAKGKWSGFVLAPVFTAKKRRLEHLRKLGLPEVQTVIPLPSEIPAELRPLILNDPARANEADLWAIVPTSFAAKISPRSFVGSNPAFAFKPGTGAPSCGHVVGFRLLGPLKVEWLSSSDVDLTLTCNANGPVKGESLFRPVRRMIVSRRLADVLFDPKIRGFDPQPLLT